MSARGVCYVAVGERASQEAQESIRALRVYNTLPVEIAGDAPQGMSPKQASRWLKTGLLDWSPYEMTLYLDADTRPRTDLSAGFDALACGWDLAIGASEHQGGEAFWHVGADERCETLQEWGITPLQLQCGVMFVRRNERTAALFGAWADEYRRYEDEDQAAFMRALRRAPVRIWLLGKPWVNGAAINHYFGRLR